MIPAEVRLENSPCPNGCPSGHVPLFTARDRLNGRPGEFQVVKCCTCGLIRTDPRPTADSMAFYYPETYSPYATSQVRAGTNGAVPNGLAAVLKRLGRRVVRLNTEIVPQMPPGRMLEIGCASGSFLAHMAMRGWHVEGIEFSEMASRKAREAGFDVQNTSIERAIAPSHKLDLVVGWMVLEHLHQPVPALRKLAQWSHPGARLAISVPNAASWDFRIFRDRGYALQLPTHLYHFTPATVTALLSRAGWTVDRIFHQRMLGNLLGSVGLVLEDWQLPRSWSQFFLSLPARGGYFNHALYPVALPLSLLGQTGRMTVWAHRTEAC